MAFVIDNTVFIRQKTLDYMFFKQETDPLVVLSTMNDAVKS